MEEEYKDVELIERYLEGALTPAEKTAADRRLAHDPEFAMLFKDISVLITGIQKKGRDNMLGKLGEIDATTSENTRGKQRFLHPYWVSAVAAVILVGIGVTWWIYTSTPIREPVALFREYYSPYPNVVKPIERSDDRDSTIETRAYTAYELGQYREALALFDSLQSTEAVNLYKANAYLTLGNVDKAIPLLRELENSSLWGPQATWYLGLAYLAQNNRALAVARFKILAESNNTFSARAKEILNKLNP